MAALQAFSCLVAAASAFDLPGPFLGLAAAFSGFGAAVFSSEDWARVSREATRRAKGSRLCAYWRIDEARSGCAAAQLSAKRIHCGKPNWWGACAARTAT